MSSIGSCVSYLKCESCDGTGVLKRMVKLSVKIPKSVEDGMLLRIRNRGHQLLNGHIGDLIIKIDLQDHERFSRDGHDIHCRQKISVTKAIFGGAVEVQTVEGMRNVNLQPGTMHNQ